MSLDHTDIQGQRVVVLGGTSGIGLAAAAAAAASGADITVVSNRKASVDRALGELPAGTAGHVVDLTDTAAVQALFCELGDIDHLVFTAGESLLISPLDSLDLSQARQFFELRYFRGAHCRPGRRSPPTTGRIHYPHDRRRTDPTSGRIVSGGQRPRCRGSADPSVGRGAGPLAGQCGVPGCRPLAPLELAE
jgi:NAD(P)-dependent dehydrogenase (short-subunit alcohol dehydrogenase family)